MKTPRFVPVTVAGQPCVLDLETLTVANFPEGSDLTSTLASCNHDSRTFKTFSRFQLVPDVINYLEPLYE